MKISWMHEHTELAGASLEKKIEIFHAKVWGWTIHIAELVANGGKSHGKVTEAAAAADVTRVPESGFAVMQILLSYFETIGIYVEGETNPRGRSAELFEHGVLEVFPQLNSYPYSPTKAFLKTLYRGGRCGLYHRTATGKGVALADLGNKVIEVWANGEQIVLNPHKLPAHLNQHLHSYCDRLKDAGNEQLRKNFEKCFDRDNPNP
jgi:hypothetical protein